MAGGSVPASKGSIPVPARPLVEAAEARGDPGDLDVGGRSVAEDVAPYRRLQAAAARQRLAKRAEPAAERPISLPTCLPTTKSPIPIWRKRAVHVVDEDLGQSHRFRFGVIAFRLEPEQDEGEQGGEHVEAALERVRDPALAIPGGLARGGDEGVVERPQRRALAPLAEQAGKQGQGRSPHVRRAYLRRSAFLGYWRARACRQGRRRRSGLAPAGFTEFFPI